MGVWMNQQGKDLHETLETIQTKFQSILDKFDCTVEVFAYSKVKGEPYSLCVTIKAGKNTFLSEEEVESIKLKAEFDALMSGTGIDVDEVGEATRKGIDEITNLDISDFYD